MLGLGRALGRGSLAVTFVIDNFSQLDSTQFVSGRQQHQRLWP
jgi:ABC-type phosphate transport system permease subunit